MYPRPGASLEKSRLEALRNYNILDTAAEREFDRLTELASIICDVPVALISLMDDDRQWFKSSVGVNICETARNVSFCSYAIMDYKMLVIEDAQLDLRFKDNPFVTGNPHLRFYAGMPLTDPDGYNLGTLCVIDYKPRRLEVRQEKALVLMAQTVTDLIVKNRRKQELKRLIAVEKEKEAKLQHSEKRFRSFFEYSQGLMCTHDLRGTLLSVNTAGAEMLGYAPEELKGRNLAEIIHPDFRKNMAAYFLGIREKKKVGGLMHVQHRDGHMLTWMFNNIMEEDADGVQYVIGNGIDITERVELENDLKNEKLRLSAFVEHSPAAVAMLDTSLLYVAVSRRWRQNYRITGEVEGRSQRELFPGLSDKWREICEQALQGISSKGEEERLHLPNFDSDIILRWEVLPWYQYDGSIGGIMTVTEDITESCMQREELERAKLRAEQANIAKSEFLANMSHEIRTPLNGVIGFTDLVLKTDLNSTQQQYLSIVNQSANALLSIINDILDFSKIEAGKLELDIERCDLFETSSQAADIVTYQAQKKGLEMLLNIPPDLPRFIWTDAVRLKQVLVNLLGNAVKFTEKGEIELKIVPLSDPSDPYVDFRFEVRDTGIGIKEEKQYKIFEAFSQEDASTTKRYGGTGLGLTISNKLLGMMGSRLQLISKAGMGSRFYFDVRLKAEKGEPLLEKSLDHLRKVLIVDDNANNRLILRQLLLLKNIASEEAASGFEALQLLSSQNTYDAIMMDYHMPFMNGIETIRKIRENFDCTGEKCPVMMLHSSSDDEQVISACRELDVRFRVVKPVKAQDLYKLLSRLSCEDDEGDEERNSEPQGVDCRKLTVLVAEDNQVNKLLARTILQKVAPNATLLEASDGAEAVKLHPEADIILMDIQMPLMNGYEATEKIRTQERGKRVPIIALTAANVKGEKEKCLAAGMDDFVAKPFVEESIIHLFNVWLPADVKNTGSSCDATAEIACLHFDPAVVRHFADGNAALLRDILEIASGELKDMLTAIAGNRNNIPGLKAAGHRLLGTASSAGMTVLAEMARELEHTALLSDELDMLVARVKGEIVLVREMVGEYMQDVLSG